MYQNRGFIFHSKNKIEGHTEGIGENHMKMATSSMYWWMGEQTKWQSLGWSLDWWPCTKEWCIKWVSAVLEKIRDCSALAIYSPPCNLRCFQQWCSFSLATHWDAYKVEFWQEWAALCKSMLLLQLSCTQCIQNSLNFFLHKILNLIKIFTHLRVIVRFAACDYHTSPCDWILKFFSKGRRSPGDGLRWSGMVGREGWDSWGVEHCSHFITALLSASTGGQGWKYENEENIWECFT